MPHKIHVIEADLTSRDIGQVVGERDKLGRAIAELATSTRETVHFHDYVAPVGGAPTIILECSDAFLDKVRKLPGYVKDQPAFTTPGLETARSQRIYDYFLCGGSAGPDCKIIPPPFSRGKKPPTP